jgi:phosphatidylserine decarboxylase
MPLTPYGIRVWLPILLVTALVALICGWLGWWWPMGAVIVIGLALLSFFRDPIRRVKTDLPEGTMLSPADGTVSAVLDVPHHKATGGEPAKVIRIFLSVLNVHVNRSPFDATVTGMEYQRGRFLNAQTDESAEVNEFNLIFMNISMRGQEEPIGVRQVSGMLARTIVCPLKTGDQLKRGEKFGMIMFGSTTELILPRPNDVTVHVKKGDTVKGGVTILATLQPLAPSRG